MSDISSGISRNPNLSAPQVLSENNKNEIWEQFKDSWWTGLSPEQCPGFDPSTQALHALKLINFQVASRQDVLDYFNNSWTLTELLFLSLKNFSTYTRSPYHGLRHPLIFYYGHPAVLFINKLRLSKIIDKPLDLYLEKILETGVDEMSWDDMSKNKKLWPQVEQVWSYRKQVYLLVKNIILTHPLLADDQLNQLALSPTGLLDTPLWSIFMGIEHEKIHFETSSVLIRELPIDLVQTPLFWPPINVPSTFKSAHFPVRDKNYPSNLWIKHTPSVGAFVSFGKPLNTPSFGWDNEYGHKSLSLKEFEMTQNLISNGEFYEFVASGHYQQDQYWSQEGLMWRKFRNSKRPCFWVAHGPEGLHDYKLRTLFEIIDMPWDWPVEVNFHEAQAYALWKNTQDQSPLCYRLPTEAEHKSLLDLSSNPVNDPVLQASKCDLKPSNIHLNNKDFFNFNFMTSSPWPVNFGPTHISGHRDLLGNVWQWVLDQFQPLDNFKIHPLYDDFSTPCFDGKHQMMLGGSFISCGHEASVWARFHFRPHFFQHSGFRLARTLDGSCDNSSTQLNRDKNFEPSQRFDCLLQTQSQNWWKNSDSLIQPLDLPPHKINQLWQKTASQVEEFEKAIQLSPPKGLALDLELNDIPNSYHVPYQPSLNFPDRSTSFDQLLKTLFNELAPLGQQPGHPGYMAYVAGAANAVSNLGQAIAQTINQFTGHYSLAPGLVTIEQEVIRWFCNSFELPMASAGGVITTGGSMANLLALAAARSKYLKSEPLHKARFYVSNQSHHCLSKNLLFLGFSNSNINFVNTDAQSKIDLIHLKALIDTDLQNGFIPVAILATAGTTHTGSIDPLFEISQIAKAHNIWFHIDGAYGALFYLTKYGKSALKGLSLADSIALDPHKSLSLAYGTGMLLAKNQSDLIVHEIQVSSYMPPSADTDLHPERVDYSEYSFELSRDPRGVRLWLAIKYFGINPFILNLDEKLELSQYLYNELMARKDLLAPLKPELSIVTFSHKNPELTKKLLVLINSKNNVFLTGTQINGNYLIRVCLLGFRTHFDTIQKLLSDIDQSLKDLG